jgi:hypothetical protein
MASSKADTETVIKDQSPEQMEELRAIGKLCADTPAVQAYVKKMCDNASVLFQFLGYSEEEFRVLAINKNESKYDGGTVDRGDIPNVMRDGNIRERMALLMQLGKHCEMYTKLYRKYIDKQDLPEVIDPTALAVHLNNAETLTLLSRPALEKAIRDCDKEVCGLFPCASVHAPLVDNPIYAARFTGMPFIRMTRKNAGPVHPDNKSPDWKNKPVKLGDAVYPPLSDREVRFLKKHMSAEDQAKLDAKDPDTELPWMTGYSSTELNPRSFYYALLQKYKEFQVAGISGAATTVWFLCGLFKDADIVLTTLACVAWMGPPPDHSCAEILMALKPEKVGGGLESYTVDVDGGSVEFVRRLIKTLGAPPEPLPGATVPPGAVGATPDPTALRDSPAGGARTRKRKARRRTFRKPNRSL